MRLSTLQEALGEHGQRLSLDPPGDPTVGALLARNLSGPLRHRFGAPRDLVLGVTLVLADGTIANAGGKVVKNVAGYDLARLVCGSEGRLALIARASFRLHPLPKAARTLAVETDDAPALVARAPSLAAPTERARRPPPGRRPRPVRGIASRGRGADRGRGALVGGVEVGVDAWERSRAATGRRARTRALRPGPARRDARRARRSRRPSRSRRRLHGGRAAKWLSVTKCGRRPRSSASGASSTRTAFSPRDPRAHRRLRPLRLLPADLPDVRALERGDGLPARAHPPDGRAPRRDRDAERDRQRRTSTAASAAWPASRSCPSGVRYDRLIETTRAAVEEEYDRPLGERLRPRAPLPRAPLPRPHARGARARAARAGAAVAAAAPAARRRGASAGEGDGDVPTITPAVGAAAGRVGLLTGCVQSAVFPDVNAATARVLAADGYEVVAPPQGCCGALSVHAGRLEEGRAFARRLSGRSRTSTLVVVNSSGCGSHLKELGWLLGDERAGSVRGEGSRRGRVPRGDPAASAPAPAPDEGRPPGSVPRPARTGVAAGSAQRARPDRGARGRRACRAGPLLRLRRDLQHRAARGGARARRSQGRSTCCTPARRPTRARTPAASSRSRWRYGGRAGRFPRSTRSSSSTRRSETSAPGSCSAGRGARY